MKTGVHCSVRNGFVGALEEAVALGCQTFQMFTQSPRGWKTRVYSDEEFTAFRSAREKSGISPVVVHSPYLPNLCTSNQFLYEKSLDALIADLERCENLGADYLVVHPGAYSETADLETGLNQIVAALNAAFSEVPGKSKVLIENMAGGGRRIGGAFRDIGWILKNTKESARLGVCFDTCHAYAAGYDIAEKTGVKRTLDEFDREIGLDRIAAFHVNDSKGELGGQRDLHQHLGQGHVGLTGLKELFSSHDFSGCAFILETPKDPAPKADLENLKKLRECLIQTKKMNL